MHVILISVVVLCVIAQSFVLNPCVNKLICGGGVQLKGSPALLACRRNNKEEKRKRNRDYARKFASKTGDSRKKVVVEQKRGIVAASEAKFQSNLYHLTTDDDMPPYSGFEFTA